MSKITMAFTAPGRPPEQEDQLDRIWRPMVGSLHCGPDLNSRGPRFYWVRKRISWAAAGKPDTGTIAYELSAYELSAHELSATSK